MFLIPFLTGLISIFTPSILLLVLLLIIALSHFIVDRILLIKLIVCLCLLVLILGPLLGLGVLNLSSIHDFVGLDAYNTSRIIVLVLNLIFGLWLVGIFPILFKRTVMNKAMIGFVLFLMGIVSFFISFPSTNLILGNILMAYEKTNSLSDFLLPMMLFFIGLMIPVGLILFFMSKPIIRWREYKWFKIVQVCVGVSFFVIIIFRFLMSHYSFI
jgi:cytochrome c biogenesis protein CcdA